MFNHQKKLMKIHRHDKGMNSISKKFIAQDKKNMLNEKTKLIEKLNEYMQIREDNSKKMSNLILDFQKHQSTSFSSFLKNDKLLSDKLNQNHQDLFFQASYLKNEIRKLEVQKFVESVKYFYSFKIS